MRLSRFDQVDWLRYAGLFTLACVGIPLLRESWFLLDWSVFLALLKGQPLLSQVVTREELFGFGGWWLSYLGFCISYWYLTADLGATKPRRTRLPLLIGMNIAAVAISWFSQSGLSGILLLVIAGVLPWLLPTRIAMAWMIIQNLSLVPVFLGSTDALGEPFGWFDAILQSFLYLGFSSFTFATSFVAKGQAQAREKQRQLNAELRATRALLAESSRVAERVRIARELHDLVGHHLTVLTLNLEVASHLVSGPPHDQIRQAQSVAKLLLSDVREVVGQLRDDADIDLGLALRTLVEGVPAPSVHLDLPHLFQVDDPRIAHVLLRAAQEILTNTIRHARAENLWWRFLLDSSKQEVSFHSRDDGIGAEKIMLGNGLTGMQERIQELGGIMKLDTAQGCGFSLWISLPMEIKS